MHRTMDASVVNRIVNQNPDIAKAITHNPADGPFDAAPLVAALYSFALLDNRKDGAALFEESSPAIWQAHTVFDHTCRGRDAIHWAKEFIREMFTLWEAEELWGQTPVGNRAARAFNRKIGAKSVGLSDHWAVGEVERFRIQRDVWMERFG